MVPALVMVRCVCQLRFVFAGCWFVGGTLAGGWFVCGWSADGDFVGDWFSEVLFLGICESLRFLLMELVVCTSGFLITRLLWFCIMVLRFSVQL